MEQKTIYYNLIEILKIKRDNHIKKKPQKSRRNCFRQVEKILKIDVFSIIYSFFCLYLNDIWQ